MRARGHWRLSLIALLLTAATVPLGLPASPAGVVPQVFSTAGTANSAATLDAFRAAIGGHNNGGNPPPATGGRREIR
jgi:hypothetical protein